jgi:hypothetical protein
LLVLSFTSFYAATLLWHKTLENFFEGVIYSDLQQPHNAGEQQRAIHHP